MPIEPDGAIGIARIGNENLLLRGAVVVADVEDQTLHPIGTSAICGDRGGQDRSTPFAGSGRRSSAPDHSAISREDVLAPGKHGGSSTYGRVPRPTYRPENSIEPKSVGEGWIGPGEGQPLPSIVALEFHPI